MTCSINCRLGFSADPFLDPVIDTRFHFTESNTMLLVTLPALTNIVTGKSEIDSQKPARLKVATKGLHRRVNTHGRKLIQP